MSQNLLLTPRPSPNGKGHTSLQSRSQLVETLIFTATSLLLVSWSNFKPERLQFFIKEILKRSKSSYRVVQLALFYVIRLQEQLDKPEDEVFKCPKRCFLACLILASKFLQDNNFTMKSWSSLTGLKTSELLRNEMVVLKTLDYRLNISSVTYHDWVNLLYRVSSLSHSDAEQRHAAIPLSPVSPSCNGFPASRPCSPVHSSFEPSNVLATFSNKAELAQLLSEFKVERLGHAMRAVTSDATRKRKLTTDDNDCAAMNETAKRAALS
ncbi:unnamed protein product [Kuraishia capsulata CBS 1993]|uniref:Cyclin N-terminal domain-containing protein n=1 Tax=Kuraishia capsulata CBS 1993 TaxID=1382522 RepID=W6MWJ7_9ASCO|nr:uncharacterized protein KUCA_T00003508001 [Kuraishia capsulata CBS 1993]CDK27530.1 unnamed protein product [Kuraishia capsulata CBS 1993]